MKPDVNGVTKDNKKQCCEFCKGYDVFPHTCKYCNRIHCYKHILPENHNCEGIKNIKKTLLKNTQTLTPVIYGEFGIPWFGEQYPEKKEHHNVNFVGIDQKYKELIEKNKKE